MRLILVFLISVNLSYGQGASNRAKSYYDSAVSYANKLKDYQSAINYCEKAIALDSTNARLYESLIHYQMILRRYEDALKTAEKNIQYSGYNALAYFMSGLILEKMGDSLSAFSKYNEAEERFRLKQAATPVTDMHYEFVVLNRAMNLLFLRKDSLANKVCVEYYEKHKKLESKDWLDRVSKYDRAYYEHIFFK